MVKQPVEWSLPIPEIYSSNPIKFKIFFSKLRSNDNKSPAEEQ